MNEDAIDLDRPLPRDLPQGSAGLATYRDFPVFSSRWLRRRTALFTMGFGSFGALLATTAYVRGTTTRDAFVMVASFTFGAVSIVTSGPLLATLVRHLRLATRIERPLVVASLFVGMFLSFAADSFASASIEASLHMPTAPQRQTTSPPVLAMNILALLLIYGACGGGLALRSYLDEPRQMRERARERELAALRAKHDALDAHLVVLQAQIEPHFLFNSLASVRSLIASDPATAAEAVDGLVTYLRATIPRLRGGAVESTLGEQIAICRAYLDLMRARLGRLSVMIEVTDDILALHFPPLLLMSLVENAMKHGIEPKVGHGTVTMRARREGSKLVVCVEDDGAGFQDGVGTGVGLTNVRTSLLARYGERARLTLASRPEGGAAATITLDITEAT